MLQRIVFIGLISMLMACSTTESSKSTSSSNLKEQRLSTDFIDEGIKITYTFTGKLESIEVFGQAESWRGNVEALAEADAMAKLTKFVNGQNVSTERRVRIIGKSIEDTQNNKLDKFKNQDGTISITDKQVEYEPFVDRNQQTLQDSSSQRNAKAINETIVTTVTNITSKGRLTGVRKIRDFQRNDGKVYVAVYVWSEKDQAASEYIKKRMQNKQ
jgi:hypothetical protein